VFLDATYIKGRVRGLVVSRAVMIATGVTVAGDREVLGVDVGDSEDGPFWTAFLKTLRARGPAGVQLVVSDHHLGLKQAIGAVFLGAAWQRCRVHFMRNVLSKGFMRPERGITYLPAGARVVAGETVLAPRATQLPFESQVDELRTVDPAWPHVHIEVVDIANPRQAEPNSGC
jgi:hypothetical protein